MTKATKLTKLDTKGVAIVDRGANNKRICLFKRADGSEAELTFEELVLEVVKSGDMPLDEKAIEDMCARAGLDPQATETFKAIMKLRYVYRDNAAFNGLLKTTITAPAAGDPKPGQPGAPGTPGAMPQPGAQPGAGQPPVPGAPGAQAAPGGQPPGHTPPGHTPPSGAAAPGKDPTKPGAPGEDAEATPGEEQADANGTEPGEGTPDEEQQDQAPGEGDKKKKKEPPMDAKKAEELTKSAADAIAKAADLEAKITAQDAVIKAQETAFKAQADAVKKMQDDLRLQGWVAKAEKELAHIPGETAESLAKQLFDIETLNADMAKKTYEAFKKTAEVVKASGMFKPSGFSDKEPKGVVSAEAEIEKLATEMITKTAKATDSAEVARARAMVVIAKQHPALYKRYCDEQETAARRAGSAS